MWLAQDKVLGVEVGLKLLPRDAPEWFPAQRVFQAEATMAMQLRHPGILGVFYLGKGEKVLSLIQEAFAGRA